MPWVVKLPIAAVELMDFMPVIVRVLFATVPPKAVMTTLPDVVMVFVAGLEKVPRLVKSPHTIAPDEANTPLAWLSMALVPAAISPPFVTVIVPRVLVIRP